MERVQGTILEEWWKPAFARHLIPKQTGLRRDLERYLHEVLAAVEGIVAVALRQPRLDERAHRGAERSLLRVSPQSTAAPRYSASSMSKPSSEPRTAFSTRRAWRTQSLALKFPST